jgi:hypothetical protein
VQRDSVTGCSVSPMKQSLFHPIRRNNARL